MKQPRRDREQDSGDAIRRGNHLFSTDRIEPMSQQQRSEEVSDRERQKISADFEFGNAVKSHQDERVGKKDGVVEESLGRHQYEPEERTLSMLMHDRVPNLTPG